MAEFDSQGNCAATEQAPATGMPVWTKPVVTVLDVESGTLADQGQFGDGLGSSS